MTAQTEEIQDLEEVRGLPRHTADWPWGRQSLSLSFARSRRTATMTGLRLGQDFWMLPSKLGPQCRTRSELGSLHPDLSLNSPPSSP